MGNNTLYYLFSAIAQSAAAFIAFIAVFVIFKIQMINKKIDDKYTETLSWFERDALYVGELNQGISKELLKELLSKVSGSQKSKSDNLLKEICTYEKSIEEFVGKVSQPLKNWAYIFFGSLVSLALFCNIKLLGTLMAFIILTYIGITLWNSRTIVQDSLSLKNKQNS